MRALVGLLALAGCGRLDFDPVSNQQVITGSLAIGAVTPTWVMASGGTIDVTLTGDTDGVTIAVDGAPCTPSPTAVHCVAPAHAPGSVAVTATNAAGDSTSWTSLAYVTPGRYQIGGPLEDDTSGVAVDRDGNVFVSGGTKGSLDGPNQGDFDAVLVKYDVTGQLAWVRQLGTPLYDYARDVAVDPQGNATIVGYTAGNLHGTNAGSNDVFIARYAPDGTLLWVTQTGTAGDDQGWDVAVDDAGETVVAVQTTGQLTATANAGGTDAAILHYTSSGTLDWTKQFGTAGEDYGHSVTITPDGVSYLVGYTMGALFASSAGGMDYFVARYEPDGTQTFVRQYGGAGADYAQDVMFDPTGGAWISGSTTASLDGQPYAGGGDVFLAYVDGAGNLQLTRDIGGAAYENSWGVGVASDGTVYVQCVTQGPFDGQLYAGGGDFCIVAFDHAGNHLWTRIGGTPGSDQSSSLFVDNARTGMIYMSFNTASSDIGVVKYDSTGTER
jgi:hypothetical protein